MMKKATASTFCATLVFLAMLGIASAATITLDEKNNVFNNGGRALVGGNVWLCEPPGPAALGCTISDLIHFSNVLKIATLISDQDPGVKVDDPADELAFGGNTPLAGDQFLLEDSNAVKYSPGDLGLPTPKPGAGLDASGGILDYVFKSNCSDSCSPMPEPSTLLLLGVGLAGLAGVALRRHRRK